MPLTQVLNEQFTLLQNLDFFVRILVACLCGASIGFERSKRFKEAGIRTHIIVCCAAALMMIVSKYAFADLVDAAGNTLYGAKGADPSRIASQVVSGISFLGAGVIFKHGSSVKGLTTAAGLWATAGIGLAVGAGMYTVGLFTTVTMLLLQVIMHRFAVGADSLVYHHFEFTVPEDDVFQEELDRFMEEHKMRIVHLKMDYSESDDAHYVSYDMTVRMPHSITAGVLDQFLRDRGQARSISYTAAG